MKIWLFISLFFLSGCVNYNLHDYYERQLKRNYGLPNDFLAFDTVRSTFIAGFLHFGGQDTVYGNYEKQRNSLALNPFYTKVKLRETFYSEDTVKIQFFTRNDPLPLPKNWIIFLNDAEYKIDSLGMVFFPLAVGDSLNIKVSGPLMTEGGFTLKNRGNIQYEVWLDMDGNYNQEVFIYRVRRNKIKSKAGSVYYAKEGSKEESSTDFQK